MAKMKKKRSLRGLGLTPERHASEAARSADASAQAFKSVKKEAESKRCATALLALQEASEAYGSAITNMTAGNLTRKNVEIPDFEYMSASKAFKKHCLVGGGLSGVKRRRK